MFWCKVSLGLSASNPSFSLQTTSTPRSGRAANRKGAVNCLQITLNMMNKMDTTGLSSTCLLFSDILIKLNRGASRWGVFRVQCTLLIFIQEVKGFVTMACRWQWNSYIYWHDIHIYLILNYEYDDSIFSWKKTGVNVSPPIATG